MLSLRALLLLALSQTLVTREIKMVTYELLHLTVANATVVREASQKIVETANKLDTLASTHKGGKLKVGEASRLTTQAAHQREKASLLNKELDRMLVLIPEVSRGKRALINVGGVLRDLLGVASNDDRKRDEVKLEDKIKQIYQVEKADKRLMAKVMKKEERMIVSNTHHITVVDDTVKKVEKLLARTDTEIQLLMEMSKLEHTVDNLFWTAKATLNNIWRLVDKAMGGRITIDMISEEDLEQMNYQMVHIRPGLRPAYDNIRDILRMYTTDIVRTADLLQISMRIPYTDTGTFEASFYADEAILVGDGMFAIASPPQWVNCADGICRERLCQVRKPAGCTSRKPRGCLTDSELVCRQINPTTYEILPKEDVSVTVRCPGRSKEEHKMKAKAYYTLSIDSTCEVNEALMVITPVLLSTEDTGHGASRLLTEEASILDRMEKTLGETTDDLNKTDRRLTDLSASLNTFNMTGTGSVLNATNTWKDWQAAQEERMVAISKDVQDLQEDGFIPEDVHEHATWATSTIVFIVLIILIIAIICISKKFSFLKEQIGNALRTVTP